MIAARTRALARLELLQNLNACNAGVYRLIAGAGFGKSTLAWELARTRGPASLCDLSDVRSDLDAWRRLIMSLAKLAGTESERILQESLTLTFADSGERDGYLRALAQQTPLQGCLLVENAEHLMKCGDGGPLRALVEGRPSCTVIICSRHDLDLRVAQTYAPHEFITVRERDLRFDLQDIRGLLTTPVGSDATEKALAWSAGWPLAACRAIELLGEGHSLPSTTASEFWLRDLLTATIETAPPARARALLRLAVIRGASKAELGAQLPFAPFVEERPDGTVELHALAREELLRLYPQQCAREREAVLAETMRRGDYIRLAELSLQSGDLEAAADALVLVDHDFYRMPDSRYVSVLEHLDRTIVLQRPQLWMVSEICLKSDFLSMNHELEPVFRAQAHSLAPRTRMACGALVCFRKGEYDGRWEEGLKLLDEFERTYGNDCVRPRDFAYAAMYRYGAASHGGVNIDGSAYWRDYGEELAAAPIFYGESLYYDATRAYFRADATATLAAIERYLSHVRAYGYPSYRRASLYRSLFMCWELDPDGSYVRYRHELLDLLREPATPADLVSRLAWEMLDATTGVPPYRDGPILSTGCLTSLMLASEADDFDTVSAAMRQASALSGNAALRVVNVKLSVAAFAFDPQAYAHVMRDPFEHFDASAAPALRACVRRLLAGESGGILEPLASRFRIAGERFRNCFFVDVTLGRMRQNGVEVHLGDREFELLVFLAISEHPVGMLELMDVLWPDSGDAAARNALKVCMSRIRSRTQRKDIIVTAGGDVLLSQEHVQTDLARARRLLRLAHEGSAAAKHAARAILERPTPKRYESWRTRKIIAERLGVLAQEVTVL